MTVESSPGQTCVQRVAVSLHISRTAGQTSTLALLLLCTPPDPPPGERDTDVGAADLQPEGLVSCTPTAQPGDPSCKRGHIHCE